MAAERPVAARPCGAGFQQRAELALLDERDAFQEAGVRSPLKPHVDGLPRRGGSRGRTTQEAAAVHGDRGHGVQLLSDFGRAPLRPATLACSVSSLSILNEIPPEYRHHAEGYSETLLGKWAARSLNSTA